MKPRTIILLVVAVVCGLAAMYMTSRLLADKGAPPPVNMVKVLVSKQKISPWTSIKKPEDMFEVKEVPEGTYSPKCITDFKKLQDMALKHALDEQMAVTPEDLLSDAASGIISALKPGQRAVAIRVTPESLAGGFVLPFSKVDVMFIKKRGDTDSDTQIILQDMLVLAVDTKNTREDGVSTMLGSTATLAATPEESEELALAGSLGDLRLLLRTSQDPVNVNYKPVSITQLGHPRRSNDETRPGAIDTDVASNGNGAGTVAPFKAPETKPAPAPTPPPAAPVVEPPPPEAQKTHELWIVNGDTESHFTYKWDKKNNCWENNRTTPEAGKSEDAPKSKDAGKPEEAPKPPAVQQDRNGPVG